MTAIQPKPDPHVNPASVASHAARDAIAIDQRVTYRTLVRRMRAGETFACLTAYDATTARWLSRAGVPVLLVGDSAAEVILGLDGTIHAPLDFLITLTAAVRRGAPLAWVLGDMPFMSYQADHAEAMRNAARFLTEGQADAVKVEVDAEDATLIRKMDRAGIPVVAHIGCRPQHVRRTGYRVVGRTAEEVRAVCDEARTLADAGACMLLLEATTAETAQAVVDTVDIPVIGCGGGDACHGQIVVTQDLLGLSEHQPSFAPPISAAGDELIRVARDWVDRVTSRQLGEHPYRMRDGEAARLDS